MDDSDSSINKASGSSFDLNLTGATESGSGSGSIGAGNIHSNRNWFADMEESFLVSLKCFTKSCFAVAYFRRKLLGDVVKKLKQPWPRMLPLSLLRIGELLPRK